MTAPNVIAECRKLSPGRALAPWQARSIAERQAYRFHRLLDITEPPFPTEAIEGLPRVEVHYVDAAHMAGATRWNPRLGAWRILVNRNTGYGKRRYSLAHELKHVIDHPQQSIIYRDSHFGSAYLASERTAEYFAACLLMPKAWVQRCYYDEGFRDPLVLARRFHVSATAMRWRFDQLGLLIPEVAAV